MFSKYKEALEVEEARLEHNKELRKDRNARYYKKHRNDVKVKKAKEILKIYDEHQENEKQVPEFAGY